MDRISEHVIHVREGILLLGPVWLVHYGGSSYYVLIRKLQVVELVHQKMRNAGVVSSRVSPRVSYIS